MNKNLNNIYTVTPTTLTYGGEALGRLPDGRAVFVPFTLPGETARIRLVEDKKRYARAELLEVIEPSPERVEPICAHFGVCGGCHYQHLPYEAQLTAKAEILRDQLERIGKIEEPPLMETIPSPLTNNYRNHVQFHLTGDGALGFKAARSGGVLPIRECHLPEEPINILWPQLDFETIQDIERVGIRLGLDDDLQIMLEGSSPDAPQISIEDISASAVHLSESGTLVLAGSDHVFIEVLERAFRVSAGSFFQTNTPAAELMVNHLLDELQKYIGIDHNTTLVDAYCGVGLFSAFLAPLVGRLVGIESSPGAVEDFVVNLDEFENVELYEAPVEHVLPGLDMQPEVIVLDPPRGGLDRRVIDAILELKPRLLAYVSCDPSTLARDGGRLIKGGYHLEQITPIDLFPQTYHIESVSFWTRMGD